MTDSSRPGTPADDAAQRRALIEALNAGPVIPAAPAPSRDGDTKVDTDTSDVDNTTDDKSTDDEPKGLKAKTQAKAKSVKENWPKRWTFKWFRRWTLIIAAALLFNYLFHPLNWFDGKAGDAETHQSQTKNGPQGRKGAAAEAKGDKLSFKVGNGYVYLVVNGDKKVTDITMTDGLSAYDTAYFGTGAVPEDNNVANSGANRCDQDSCTLDKPADLCSGWLFVAANIDDGSGGLTYKPFVWKSADDAFASKCS